MVAMNILLHAVRDTLFLLWQVLPVMFVGLFGVEVLVRLGLMMSIILMVVTLIVQLLVHAGALAAFEALIAPAADILGLPAAIVAPVSVYIVSPIVGIGAMSTLLHQHLVTEYQAIVALLAGGFLMIPLTRLRGTLPRYVSILGWKNGSRVLTITTTLSLVARGLVLGWVFLFFHGG